MKRLIFGSEEFEYEIIKKKKKNIGITVTAEGQVKVTAPYFVDDKYIEEVIYKRAEWIISKLGQLHKLREDFAVKRFITGDSLYYLGRAYEIVSLDVEDKGVNAGFNGENFLIYINKSIKNCERKDIVRTALVKWYRERAREVFEERTSFYSRMLKLYPVTIRIKEQKTMWGSCSGRGNINYNWRLIMAPIDILDYVVVHELCHLKHNNHSKEFWNLVESIIPDYSQRRKWLKENGMKLSL